MKPTASIKFGLGSLTRLMLVVAVALTAGCGKGGGGNGGGGNGSPIISSDQSARQSAPQVGPVEPVRSNAVYVQEVTGKTYYVDAQRGRDSNAGSQNAPLKTLKAANQRVAPGDQTGSAQGDGGTATKA